MRTIDRARRSRASRLRRAVLSELHHADQRRVSGRFDRAAAARARAARRDVRARGRRESSASLRAAALRSRPLLQPLLLWLRADRARARRWASIRATALVFMVIFALGMIWHAHIDRFYDDPGVRARASGGRICSPGTLACVAGDRHGRDAHAGSRTTRSPTVARSERSCCRASSPAICSFFLPIAYALARSAKSAALRATRVGRRSRAARWRWS